MSASIDRSEPKGSPIEKLLTEIRENRTYFDDYWRPNREQAKIDMKYRAGDPWDGNEREFRVKHDRPVMTWDELSPYVNQLVNDVRQNKRAIKINPKGYGATDKTAELRENHIRAIQYNSRAQSAFTTAFQGAVERSYGYFGINVRLVSENLPDDVIKKLAEEDPGKLFEQELYIYRIPNPDAVLFNPNYKEQDCSDSTECFVDEILSWTKFRRDYPNAKYTDWSGDFSEMAPGWTTGEKEVRVSAYWKVLVRKRKLYLLTGVKDPADINAMYEDELGDTKDAQQKWLADDKNKKRIKRDRTIESRSVKQYTTNGLEILDESDEIPIPWIPIVPVFGQEMWVDEGSGSKRKLISLIRMARDPFMFYCYLRSQEAEEAGQTPRSPLKGYVGQFETDRDAIENCNKIPRSFLQFDPVTDSTSGQLLPLPVSAQFTPNFQQYEIAAEAARRAIQTAMGGANLPVAAQRRNEKSGVALKEIDEQEAQGTFQFIDNYDFALEHGGRIIEAWYPYVYDTKRDVEIQMVDGTRKTVTLNDPEFEEMDKQGQMQQVHYDSKTGDHGVTVAVGPDNDSQRDAASDFVDIVVQNIQNFAATLPPGAVAKILALSIRLKQLGPIGDEMADTISPPPDQAAQQQAIQQGQVKLQQQAEIIQKLQEELQKLQLEKAGKVIDNQFKGAREAASASHDAKMKQLDVDVQVLKALLASKQNISDQEYDTFRTVWQENHGAAHELALQAHQQSHEQALASQAQTAAAQSQASDQAADAQSQQADQAHQMGMAENAEESAPGQ